jgi:hypothetical protein
MLRKVVVIITLVSFVFLQACTTTLYMPMDEFQHKTKSKKHIISGAETLDGQRYKFDITADNHAVIQADSIKAMLVDGSVVNLPLSQVKTVYIERFSPGKTIGLTLGILGSVAVVLILAFINSPIAAPGS